jgi:replicative superfamily II helicase
LSRAHGKGPLRPAKGAALKDRFASHREQKDVIVKLYTGQGKTLIGLLMLHFQLNNGKGPALQPTTVVDRSSRSASEAQRRLSAEAV